MRDVVSGDVVSVASFCRNVRHPSASEPQGSAVSQCSKHYLVSEIAFGGVFSAPLPSVADLRLVLI